MKIIFFLFLLLVSNTYSQLIPSAEHIQFPETIAGTKDSVSFTIQNASANDVTIDRFNHYSGVYSFSDSLFSIPVSGSVTIKIYYTPLTNVVDEDLLIYSSSTGSEVLAISVSGSGKYNDSYHATTFNKYDNALKSALSSLVVNHTSLGYNTARDKMYMEIDNKKVNGQGAPVNTLECVYTGREAVGYIDRQDCQNNYGFNTEHTWPQSMFSSAEPMLSDLFHLFPTDATANNVRGNLHFGRVVANIDWQVGGSKRGKDSLNETVFEPRDVHKGNIARSLLYFTIRYTNLGNFLDQKQEDLFRIWNYSDPADTIELRRNNAIAQYQQKRNPFIDHPEFIDRIFSFRTNVERPRYAVMNALPETLFFDSTAIGDTAAVFFYILNSGNAELVINSIETSAPFFVFNSPQQVNPFSFQKADISFIPADEGAFSSIVVINSTAGSDTVYISGYGTGGTTLVTDNIKPESFELSQNFPNPFNPSTKIRYKIAGDQIPVSLKIYDVLGNEIEVLVDAYMTGGEHEIDFDSNNISSGIYYYKLSAGGFVSVKKMMIIK